MGSIIRATVRMIPSTRRRNKDCGSMKAIATERERCRVRRLCFSTQGSL